MAIIAPDPDASEDDAASPAERRKAKVRDTIISAAERLFAEHGADAWSMRKLAESVDYSPAAIYKYFRNKDELFCEIRDQFFERLLARIETEISKAGDGPVDRKACLRAYVETGLEEPNHYAMLFAGNTLAPPKEGDVALQAANRLEGLIADGVASGEFRPLDTRLAAQATWASLHGLVALMIELPGFPTSRPGSEHITADMLIDFHLDQILRGFAA
ncbi:MAG: TetR/AcrR family transcriptional regulator [Maricaulaceae bacterium]